MSDCITPAELAELLTMLNLTIASWLDRKRFDWALDQRGEGSPLSYTLYRGQCIETLRVEVTGLGPWVRRARGR